MPAARQRRCACAAGQAPAGGTLSRLSSAPVTRERRGRFRPYPHGRRTADLYFAANTTTWFAFTVSGRWKPSPADTFGCRTAARRLRCSPASLAVHPETTQMPPAQINAEITLTVAYRGDGTSTVHDIFDDLRRAGFHVNTPAYDSVHNRADSIGQTLADLITGPVPAVPADIQVSPLNEHPHGTLVEVQARGTLTAPATKFVDTLNASSFAAVTLAPTATPAVPAQDPRRPRRCGLLRSLCRAVRVSGGARRGVEVVHRR